MGLASAPNVQGIWAWTKIGPTFEEHVAEFLTQLVESDKVKDLTANDTRFVLSCAGQSNLNDPLQHVLRRFFADFGLSECDTPDLIGIFIGMGRLPSQDAGELNALIEELGTFRCLRWFRPSDFVSVLNTYLTTGAKNEAFVDRLAFEAGQVKQLAQFSVKSLSRMQEMLTDAGMQKNVIQVFANELSQRKVAGSRKRQGGQSHHAEQPK